MGDEVAASLGVNVKKLRAACIALICFMTAATISFVGVIGFVCLVSPHVARIIIGNDNRVLVFASALVGANLLLASDTIARTIVAPLILPVGAVTSCVGGPFFVYLLLKSRRVHWT
jgi:iron complex transport system permease protein